MNLSENFKDKLIVILIIVIILTNFLWCIAHISFIRGYFWSDYSYIENSNINTNINPKGGKE